MLEREGLVERRAAPRRDRALVRRRRPARPLRGPRADRAARRRARGRRGSSAEQLARMRALCVKAERRGTRGRRPDRAQRGVPPDRRRGRRLAAARPRRCAPWPASRASSGPRSGPATSSARSRCSATASSCRALEAGQAELAEAVMRMHILGARDFLWRVDPWLTPLAGLRVVEFGQLLAGPYVGTLLGDFGADVVKVEAPPDGDPMRDWGRLRHNDHSLWWSILARNKRSITLNLRTERGPGARAPAVRRRPTSWSRTSAPARWRSGGWGPRTCTRATRARSTRACPATARPAATATAPGFASRRRGDRRPAPHQRLPRPGAAAQRHLARRHARRPVGLPGHPARALRARRARREPARWSTPRSPTPASRCSSRRSSSTRRPASCASRPARGCRASRRPTSTAVEDGKWVVIAANHDTLWKRLAALMGRPELGDDERFDSHHARGENEDLLDELIGEWAAQHTAAELDQLVNEAGVVCAPVYAAAGHLRRPVLPRARAARRARGRGARRDDGAGRGAEAERDAGQRSARRRAGPWAPTRTRCWASSGVEARASSPELREEGVVVTERGATWRTG